MVSRGTGSGSISAPSALATDPNGANTSTTSKMISLDAGNGSNPSLTVNAANPADVIFTVSGLQSGYTGTVTFTDSTNKSDVVSISGNGPYSANLSNLADGTLTYLLKASNSAGNVVTVDPTTTLGVPALPSGVTLQQIDGGSNYYANNGFTYAANAGSGECRLRGRNPKHLTSSHAKGSLLCRRTDRVQS